MKKIIKEIKSLIIHYLYIILYKIRPRYAADLMYYHAFHKRMDLENPKNLIEKINWLLPSLLSKKKQVLILNRLRCESHRQVYSKALSQALEFPF